MPLLVHVYMYIQYNTVSYLDLIIIVLNNVEVLVNGSFDMTIMMTLQG